MSSKFNVGQIITCTEVEGPFRRLCIWFQGCDKDCKNCFNQELRKKVPKNIITDDEIVDIIKQSIKENNIEGVTLLGGEPLLQINLPILMAKIKNLGLGIILFTGYNFNEIPKDIVINCDLIIDGPFIEEKKDNERRLIGSTNQKLIFITDRYKDQEAWFFKENHIDEINVTDKIVINGDNK